VNNFGYGGANAHAIMEDYASFLTSTRTPGLNGSKSNLPRTLTNGHTNGNTDGHTNGDTNGHHQEPIFNRCANGNAKEHKEQPGDASRIFVLSGKDEQATLTMAANLKEFLATADIQDHGEQSLLNNLAHTLGARRSRFPWVSAMASQSVPALVCGLETARMKPARTTGENPRLGFLFTGQGAQWWAMGRELIEAYPTFQASLAESDQILKNKYGSSWSLVEELSRDEATSKVSEQYLSMPACVAIQLALVQLLESWGITPSAVTSHSSGEVASAYAAGVISKTAALGIGYARGQFVANAKGGMIAVGLGVEGSNEYIARVSSGRLVAACMNSPTSTTVSGDVVAIEELDRLLKEDGVFARRLRVDAAYHSHHMAPYAEEYTEWILKHVDPEERSSIVPGSKGRVADVNMDVIYSSPTVGRRITSAAEIRAPAHWAKSLVNPVRFVEAFQHMYFNTEDVSSAESQPRAEVDMIIEIGPHSALGGPVKEILSLPDFGGREVPYSSCLMRKNNAVETVQALVCDLLRNGYPVDLDAVNFPYGRHEVEVMHDLPHYPWSHQVRYWTEPRENKAHRERLEAPHDLLGSLAIGTNREAPSWRNLIDAADIPWVRDHTLQTNIVYPGSGLICMAIEGAVQACQAGDRKISGYQLRDIDISQALVVPEMGNVETRLQLRPCSDKAIYAKGFKEFAIHSVNSNNKWTEICKGLISVEFAGERAQSWSSFSNAPSLASELSDYTQPLNLEEYRMRVFPRELYANMRSVGIHHGPVFQNLKTIRAHIDQCVSILQTPDTAAIMPFHYQHDHIIHPATLDTVLQSAYPALPESRSKVTEALIPRTIKSLWISHDINKSPGHLFRSYTAVTYKDARRVETRIVVCDDAIGEDSEQPPVIKLSGFEMQSMGNSISSTSDKQHEQGKFSAAKWVPDLDLMLSDRLKKQLGFSIPEGETEIIIELRQVCLNFVHDALAALSDSDVTGLQGHFVKFHTWMQVQSQLAKQNKLGTQSCKWASAPDAEKTSLIERVKGASLNGEMVCQLGPQIVSMMKGETAPLELMMQEKLLSRYYEHGLKWDRSHLQIGALVKQFSHKHPRAKILEIGAGTGGATKAILENLGTIDSGWGPLAASYDFTDVSEGFFEAAQERLAAWKGLVRYKKLNVEQNVSRQGFKSGTYDLIVASQVLHATKSMKNTMSNVRKLLKPGGRLLIIETTQDPVDIQFVFGLLPGWWLSK
jgi:acyl transferase domain-containing protein/ubiquinone/menaquinone biosynthesis C-methylase UbiE